MEPTKVEPPAQLATGVATVIPPDKGDKSGTDWVAVELAYTQRETLPDDVALCKEFGCSMNYYRVNKSRRLWTQKRHQFMAQKLKANENMVALAKLDPQFAEKMSRFCGKGMTSAEKILSNMEINFSACTSLREEAAKADIILKLGAAAEKFAKAAALTGIAKPALPDKEIDGTVNISDINNLNYALAQAMELAQAKIAEDPANPTLHTIDIPNSEFKSTK